MSTMIPKRPAAGDPMMQINLLATLAAGTFAGAQLMIGVSFAWQWRLMRGPDLAIHFAQDWTHIAATIIPFALLQTVFMPLAVRHSQNMPDVRRLWRLCLAGWLTNCAITAIYHFPIVLASMQARYTPDEIGTVVAQWVLVHWLRVALGFAVFALALAATVSAARSTRIPAS